MRQRLLIFVALAALVAIAATLASAPRSLAVTGVVVSVDARSLTDVRSFTLRKPGGETMTFTLDALENRTQFPPGHLAEHIATSVPVVVTYRVEDGVAAAIRLEDVPGPSPS
ncbi:MAG: hypothetical protein ABI555_09235 [Chloroflexota bacterium]